MRWPVTLWRTLAETGRMMVGHTPYQAYCQHMATRHPDQPLMDERAFFRHRQQARYGRGGGRCC